MSLETPNPRRPPRRKTNIEELQERRRAAGKIRPLSPEARAVLGMAPLPDAPARSPKPAPMPAEISFSVMRALLAESGPLTVGDMSRMLGTSGKRVWRVMHAMEAEGIVEIQGVVMHAHLWGLR